MLTLQTTSFRLPLRPYVITSNTTYSDFQQYHRLDLHVWVVSSNLRVQESVSYLSRENWSI